MKIDRLYSEYQKSSGVSIDTRTLQEGEMFFALSGDNFDGNKFAQIALDNGASCVVVSERSLKGENVFFADDCLVALQNLASFHRLKLIIPVLAITGSNGKTTTKELIHIVLSKKYNTVATKGNLNNHIGVPLSILQIKDDTEIAIIEMGANHIGEIELLCAMARPTHGLITNIGKAHLEGFGSLEGVKKAKSELYQSLVASNGFAFVNISEPHLDALSAKIPYRLEYSIGKEDFTGEGDYRFLQFSSETGTGISLQYDDKTTFTFESALYGTYNAPNIATAVVVGLHFGVGREDIEAAIRSCQPENNRSQIVRQAKKTILLDAYNANPVSMRLAITDLAKRDGVKSLILGGMNELGDHSSEEHVNLLKLVDQFEWAKVILIGEHFSDRSQNGDFQWFADVSAYKIYLANHPLPNGLILLKGSRSLKLESLLHDIK